jgi:menaquinone-specific isochorismate synthase
VANCLVEPDSRLEAVAERIWRAHGKFRSFSYAVPGTGDADLPISEPVMDARGLRPVEVGPPARFRESVSTVLGEIDGGACRKVVLARAVDVVTNTDLHPLAALNRLRVAYPDCYSFSVANGCGQSFIGATPERLVEVSGRNLQTDALAGSTRRGETAVEDAILARGLLQSEKDVREQRLVLDSILRRLEALGVTRPQLSRLGLLQLSNVQHLHTAVRAELPEALGLLRLVEELHPTPAVGGTPREFASARIRDLEPFSRGLYAGPLGWVDADGDGEFVVAIRSALIDGGKARVYAGAGIVEGSDADREYAETELKLEALLDNLIGS